MIPPRGRSGYNADEDPCAECAEINCRGRWLLLPLIIVVLVAIIYALVPSDEKHHSPPPSGSLAGELSDDLSDS